MEQNFEYFAFVSYKREDERWAKWLQRKLEHYKLPTVIANERPELPKKIRPVFKDTTDIKPGVLPDVLIQNLKSSKYLIVICSPRAAKSQWVGKEISEFIVLGKQNNIILFIVDGIPYSNNPDTECYHPVIKDNFPEMLGVNIYEDDKEWKYIKKQKAFIRVVSSLLNVSFDSLWQRQKRRIIRNWVTGIFFGFLFVMTIIGVSVYQYRINQPFDVHISLKEITYHNPNLPFENGKVYLCFDHDTVVSKTIQTCNDIAGFLHIPGKYRDKKAKIWFDMQGYSKQDSIVLLYPSLQMRIFRDDTYGIVKGSVLSFNGMPIEDASVLIGDKETQSNSKGQFEVSFGIPEQTLTRKLIVRKSGYKEFEGCYTVGKDWKIVLEKE